LLAEAFNQYGSNMIGISVPQVSAREKVLGLASYVGDIKMAGMLHAKVLRSPYPHARIVSIDTSRARAIPGVKLVLTGEDSPTRKWGLMKKEHHILAVGKVRFAGEEVAAVAAVSEAVALDAIEAIRVEYEELPAIFDPTLALEAGAPEVHEGTGNLAFDFHINHGDVDSGFAASAAVYEATYEVGYQYHGYMEPMGTIAAVDGNGRITVWCPSAGVFFARARLAEALDMPESLVRVIQTTTGGGFGGKNSEDANTPIAALLALKAGRPVRLVNNRLEDFLAARAGLPARVWLKMGLSKDGEILAKDSRIVADNGAYTGLAPAMTHVAAMRSDSLHRLKNVRCHARLAFTNKIPSGALRGFGNPQMGFPLNSHLTVLAEMIGMDPVEVHLRNAIRTGDTSVHGWEINSGGLPECIKQAAEGIGWSEKRSRRRDSSTLKRGVGFACAIHVSGNREMGNWDGSTVTLRVNQDGRVTLISGESDVGQGSSTVLCQIVAKELGIPVGHVTINQPDTDVAPFCFGAIASRVTIVAGNAAMKAAREVREKLISVVATKLEVAPADLVLENGMIHVVGIPAHGVSIADAARLHIFRSGGEGIYVRATWDPPTVMSDKTTHYGNVSPGYSFAAQAVEVEVDTETGQVRLLDSFVADDCGKALNPMAVHGQTSGATAQGIAWALYEGYVFDGGRLVNGNFADYTMPTADALPELRSSIVECAEPNGPYGAKGASETAVGPPPGAIANAIYDAVGVRINTLPISPEKVFAALQQQRQERAGA
jgi:CO/xanthine dehydrogenase Mo-binding subunit